MGQSSGAGRPRVVGNTPEGDAGALATDVEPPVDDAPHPAEAWGQGTTIGRSSTSTRSNGGPSNRTPPYNEDAEASLLGAMLLSSDAVEVGVSRLDVGMFYVPRHRLVFGAIEALYVDGIEADPITVGDRLKLDGTLDQLPNGAGFLVDLESNTPATSNARFYADAIERDYRRRLVIAEATAMATDAYVGTDWHATMGRLLDVGQRNGVVHSLSSFDDVDLAPILAGDVADDPPCWLQRSDGSALLYPGKVHDFHSEPSVGKTWLACHAIAEVITAGGSALYLDYEDRPATIVGRLLALGVPREVVGARDRFRYIDPTGGVGDAERAHLAKVLDELGPDVVILDGVATSIARCGYDENSNSDVTRWADLVVNPLAAAGAAVVLLDHVSKPSGNDNAKRARGGRGAGAKLALISGASYEVKIGRAYSRTRAGSMRAIIAKDRIGFVGGIGEVAAEVLLRPSEEGKRIAIELNPKAASDSGGFRLTGLMERLSKVAEDQSGPVTAERLFAGLNSKRVHLDQALADLVDDGYLAKLTATSSPTYRSLKRYREDPGDPKHGEPLHDDRTTSPTPEQPTLPDPHDEEF